MNLQMAREFCAVLFIAALAGCATVREVPVVQGVEIPIERECLPDDLPVRPEVSTDDELRALPSDQYVLTVSAERQELRTYAVKAEAAIKGCR